MTQEPLDSDTEIAEIVQRLAVHFPSQPPSAIHEVVAQSYQGFKDVRVRDFVQVLVEKQAKKHLKQLDG